jgi:glycerophosphoryl diester phosphodiesterase
LIGFSHLKGIKYILEVLGNLDKRPAVKGNQLYLDYIKQGVDILATDRPETVF